MSEAEVFVSAGTVPDSFRCSRWVYFGKSSSLHRQLLRELGASKLPRGAELVDRAAAQIRRPFVQLDRCFDLDRRTLEWDASTIGERSPYTSDLFYECCIVHAFVELLESRGRLLVVVDQAPLASELDRQARLRGARTASRRPRRESVVRRLRPAAALGRGLVVRVRFLAAAVARKRRLRALPTTPAVDLDVVLVTWASSATFPADAPLERDTYYGELPGRLRQAGLRVGYLASPLSWVHAWDDIVDNVRGAHDPVLLPEECVGLAALVAAAWTSLWRRLRLARPFVLDGVDMSALVRLELLREQASPRQLWALQYAAIGSTIASTGARLVVHPFENQAWEKTLRAGLARAGVPVIGYQHTPFSPLWLPYLPSERDLERGALPDRVVTIGEHWLQIFAASGYDPGRLRRGVAFRFPRRPVRLAAELSEGRAFLVVVAAGIDAAEAFELVGTAARTFRADANVRVTVKLHPAMGADDLSLRLGAELGGLPDNVTFSAAPLPDLIQHAGALVYSGTSACYDALAVGVPVVSFRSALWLDADTLPVDLPGRLRVSSEAELAATVELLRTEGPNGSLRRRREAEELARLTLSHPTGEATDLAPFIEPIEEPR